MYKLLTAEGSQKVAKEYALRRMSVILGLAVLLAFITAAALLPSAIIVHGRKEAALAIRESVRDLTGNAERASLESWAAETKRKVALLKEPERGGGAYGYFQKVLGAKPAEVKITSFSYDRSGESFVVKIYGIALDRASLLSFQSGLEASGDWEKVDLPLDALAKDKDAEFRLSLMPKKINE
jgi:hypothetical protein